MATKKMNYVFRVIPQSVADANGKIGKQALSNAQLEKAAMEEMAKKFKKDNFYVSSDKYMPAAYAEVYVSYVQQFSPRLQALVLFGTEKMPEDVTDTAAVLGDDDHRKAADTAAKSLPDKAREERAKARNVAMKLVGNLRDRLERYAKKAEANAAAGKDAKEDGTGAARTGVKATMEENGTKRTAELLERIAKKAKAEDYTPAAGKEAAAVMTTLKLAVTQLASLAKQVEADKEAAKATH